MLILFPSMLPSRLVGTDLVQAVPMLVVGAIAHWGWRNRCHRVLSLLLGQIPGVFIGARISSRYNGQELRWLLLVLVGRPELPCWARRHGWPPRPPSAGYCCWECRSWCEVFGDRRERADSSVGPS